MGFPRHNVDSHETSSYGNLAILVLSPKNTLLEPASGPGTCSGRPIAIAYACCTPLIEAPVKKAH